MFKAEKLIDLTNKDVRDGLLAKGCNLAEIVGTIASLNELIERIQSVKETAQFALRMQSIKQQATSVDEQRIRELDHQLVLARQRLDSYVLSLPVPARPGVPQQDQIQSYWTLKPTAAQSLISHDKLVKGYGFTLSPQQLRMGRVLSKKVAHPPATLRSN